MPESEDSALTNQLNTIEDSELNNSLENSTLENTVSEGANLENGNVINNTIVDSNEENVNPDNNVENVNAITENNENNSNSVPVEENQVALGTGGGDIENVNSDIDQMKKDAEDIKNNYEITLPLRGTITSRFGDREIEPKFHTGIDVARNAGSEIISATNGTVILAEEQSSYGKVLKIQNNDLVVLYAHCEELLVNVGDKITMMQPIAKVGSTGNSTGPHLHFELIYCGRYVNPEYVLEFKE